MKITIDSDYDGFFENLVRQWIDELNHPPIHNHIVISAGPYRSQAVALYESKDKQRITIDFYSALRNGFGELSQLDINRIKEMI